MIDRWLFRSLVWAALFLLLGVAPGFSFAQPLPLKVDPWELENLVAQAEKEGWNLMVVPGCGYVSAHTTGEVERTVEEIARFGGRERWLAGFDEGTREIKQHWLSELAQPVRRLGNIVWVGYPEQESGTLAWPLVPIEPRTQPSPDVPLRPVQPPREQRYGSPFRPDEMSPRGAATTSVGKALIASLPEEQRELLLHQRCPADVMDLWEDMQQAARQAEGQVVFEVQIGGYLAGHQMTDFQRRICGLAMCTANLDFSPEWLPTARLVTFGHWGSSGARWGLPGGGSMAGGWYLPLIVRVQSGPVSVGVSLRYAYPRLAQACLQVDLPVDEFKGQALLELVEWARANLGPVAAEERVELPAPVFRHITDGPTRDVTTLLTPEEADISIEVPSDVVYTQRAAAAVFRNMGIVVTGATSGSMPSPVPPTREGERERYSLVQLLNTVLRYSSRNGYFVREGNTFRLVEQEELTGRFCIDPIPFLPAEALEKPLNLAIKKGTIGEFLQAVREQTSLPLYPGQAAEDSRVPVTALVKGVPAKEILDPLTAYLNGGWERLSDGKFVLIPAGYIRMDRPGLRIWRRDEIEEHCQRMARMTLALFVEALSPARVQALQNQGLVFADLTGPARELAVAAAQLAFGVSDPDQEQIALKILGQEPDGSYQIRLWVGSAYKDFTTVAVPTIPPNPVTGWRRAQTPSRPIGRIVDTTGVR